MAPKSTRKQDRNTEQGVRTPASGTQVIESIQTMSSSRPTGTQQLKGPEPLTDGASPSFENW
jgi:hypothetical protein